MSDMRRRKVPQTLESAQDFQRATSASAEQMADLERYQAILADWNTRMNLVGPSAMFDFWQRHAFDSAQLLGLAPRARVWADLGSGAGLPGVILAIFLKGQNGARVHLIESMAKRCRFLTEVVSALGLPAEVHHRRAESDGLPVDAVTARALAPLPKLLEYGWPYLRRGAVGLFLKGQDVDVELTDATRCWKFKLDQHPSLSGTDGRILEISEVTRVQQV